MPRHEHDEMVPPLVVLCANCIPYFLSVCSSMRLAVFLFGLFAITGCVLFDLDEDSPQTPVSATSVTLNSSCTDLWKHYTDEVQLINDDETNWSAHDDNAV